MDVRWISSTVPRDRDDIRSILEAGVALDHEYLNGWIAEWDVAERWATFVDSGAS